MNKFLIAAVFAVLAATGAQAADASPRTYTKAPVAAPATNWTGFYAGVNAGYGFNDPTVSFTAGDPLINSVLVFGCPGCASPIPPASFNIGGGIFGGQIGYDWQIAPTLLVGIETDFSSFRASNTVSSRFNLGIVNGANMLASQSIDWFGTVRARLGWLQMNNLLIYGTGGFAYGKMNESVAMNVNSIGAIDANFGYSYSCPGIGTNCFVGSQSRIATGYTVGGGLEYAVWRNLTLKAEYLYVNLGSTSARASAVVTLGALAPASIVANYSDYHFNVVRIGANYRF